MSAIDFDELVAALYQAAAGKIRWRAALDPLAAALGCWTVYLTGIDRPGGSIAFLHQGGPAPPQALLAYLNGYHSLDPGLALLRAKPAGKWLHYHEYFDDSFVAGNRFYQEFLLPFGARHLSGVKLFESSGKIVHFLAVRGLDAPVWSDAELALLDRLKCHLMRAMQIDEHLQHTASRMNVAETLLEQFWQPVVLLDRNRAIVYRNRSAGQMLRAADCIVDRNGRIGCRHPSDHLELGAALDMLDAEEHRATSLRKVRRRIVRLRRATDNGVMSVVAIAISAPASIGAAGGSPLALLVFHDPTVVARPDPFILGEAFGLTPAESRVAVQLTQGRRAEDIAVANGVSIATVRSQIKALFHKTGTHRQADLVRILSSLPSLEVLDEPTSIKAA